MGQASPTLGRALEGKSPTREAHGRPPDVPNPQTLGSTVWDPVSVDPRPVSAPDTCGGLSPMGVLVRTFICGPARVSSLSIRLPADGQQYGSRGTKYPVTKCGERAACCPICPLVFFILAHTTRFIAICHSRTQEFVAWGGATWRYRSSPQTLKTV